MEMQSASNSVKRNSGLDERYSNVKLHMHWMDPTHIQTNNVRKCYVVNADNLGALYRYERIEEDRARATERR